MYREVAGLVVGEATSDAVEGVAAQQAEAEVWTSVVA